MILFLGVPSVVLTSNSAIPLHTSASLIRLRSSQPATPAGCRENIVTCTSSTNYHAIPIVKIPAIIKDPVHIG
jgi:hypothetical protein